MKKKNLIVIICLTAGLLAGCGTDMKTNGDSSKEIRAALPKQGEIAGKFLPSIDTKVESNKVIIQYQVKNVSGQAKKLTFSSGLQADAIVYDQNGEKVKQFSDGVFATQAIQEMQLENNQEIKKEFTVKDLPAGEYRIEAFLKAKEEQAKTMTKFTIKSTVLNGTGVLVGQVDPHTIEVDMQGNKEAFQLSDQAKQQFSTMNEGEKITFHFSKNGNGQKVISDFIKK